ncbi:MAG: cupin [Clostridiales bacterium 43-6]|nr:MAG: cupin [Clostridiales bacterium 43-6]
MGNCRSNRKDAGVNVTSQAHDYGAQPFVTNIRKATLCNSNYRTVLWTGTYLQLTLMSINPGEDIGLENHPELDQCITVEQGCGIVIMGNNEEQQGNEIKIRCNDVIIIPAGTWHNLINTGCSPLKLYSVYAPPQHPFGTVQATKQDAENEKS